MKIKFNYTGGVSYKASNVLMVSDDKHSIHYTRDAFSGSVEGFDVRVVPKDDLLYAVVTDDNGEVTIIPGLYTQFEVVPVGADVTRQQNIDAEAARVAADRAAKAPARNAAEKEKFAARKAARKAAYLKSTGSTEVVKEVKQEPRKVQVQSETPAYEILQTLRDAGMSEADLVVLNKVVQLNA